MFAVCSKMSDHDFWTHANFARSPQSQNSTHDAKSSDGIDDDDDKEEERFSSKYRDGTTGRPYLKEVLVEFVVSSVVVVADVVLSVGDVIFRSNGRVGIDTE